MPSGHHLCTLHTSKVLHDTESEIRSIWNTSAHKPLAQISLAHMNKQVMFFHVVLLYTTTCLFPSYETRNGAHSQKDGIFTIAMLYILPACTSSTHDRCPARICKVCDSHWHQSLHCIWDTSFVSSRIESLDIPGRIHENTLLKQHLSCSLCRMDKSVVPVMRKRQNMIQHKMEQCTH